MAAFLVEIMRSGILLMQIYQRTREGKRLGAWATQYVLLLQYCNCNEENGLVLLSAASVAWAPLVPYR
jgi:hypothetical protein